MAAPEKSYEQIMRFIFGIKDLAGTNAERRIKEVLAMGHDATKSYPVKEGNKIFNSAKRSSLTSK